MLIKFSTAVQFSIKFPLLFLPPASTHFHTNITSLLLEFRFIQKENSNRLDSQDPKKECYLYINLIQLKFIHSGFSGVANEPTKPSQ